jgi:4-hydroxy-2-oxoheptanedioate aldolase
VHLLRTVEDARQLVRDTKFPPRGRRGFGSAIAPERFNISLTRYLQQANSLLLNIVRIKTQETLGNVDEIANVDGIDILFVGPFDLG